MNFTEIFIRRPILATVLNLFLLIAGWKAIQTLVVRQYPYTSNAVISVSVAYPGANADLVRGFVTTPLEREISSADGIDFLESSSRSQRRTHPDHRQGQPREGRAARGRRGPGLRGHRRR
jgi:multidrug efflux pump